MVYPYVNTEYRYCLRLLLTASQIVVWNTLCGFAKNEALMIVGRLMAGLGASAEFAVGPLVK